jgi:VWFA-related protein
MRIKVTSVLTVFFLAAAASSQTGQKPGEEPTIRISTELVQLDVVVTDKNGHVVRGLTKDDFELFESGKKQLITFFELVDTVKGAGMKPSQEQRPSEQAGPQGPAVSDLNRTFAFVVDDLTIRYEDLSYIKQMMSNFVDNQMRPTDLVAIVRTVGGKGLLQQFTTDKALLRRAIDALTPATHALAMYNNPRQERISGSLQPLAGDNGSQPAASHAPGGAEVTPEEADIISPFEDSNTTLRALMSLGTASFVVDSMTQLRGRKSLVLISGGLPIFGSQTGNTFENISAFLNHLTDRATRAGVAIHTMDIRGLGGQSAVASFADTPARSGLRSSARTMNAPTVGTAPGRNSSGELVSGGGSTTEGGAESFGRVPDRAQFGFSNPFDVTSARMGLRTLSSVTGGLAVLNKNDFNAGLEKIIDTNEAYYLLAYTPSDNKFKGDFRKVDIKVKGDGYRVYSRRGYFAREERPAAQPTTKQEQLLAAIKSPLARRDVGLDAMLLYKAAAAPADKAKNNPQEKWGAIDINLLVNPNDLQFEQSGDKRQVSYDVAGFVFDELGKQRGGFSETINASLSSDEYKQAIKAGFPYAASTTLPPGAYQIRLAVRDNRSGHIGTMYRYLEVPDLQTGRLAASSLLLGAVGENETTATKPTPISGNRQISRKQDVRYAVIIYNAKHKDGKPQLKTQLKISQNGKVIFTEPEEPLEVSSKNALQVIKVGQFGLSNAGPGRYTLTLVITDTLADKKPQVITRSMDFVVVN